MKTVNAIKKLETAGFKVQNNNYRQYWADNDTDRISFIDQRGEVICLKIAGLQEPGDPQSDCYAGVYIDSVAQAIRLANS